MDLTTAAIDLTDLEIGDTRAMRADEPLTAEDVAVVGGADVALESTVRVVVGYGVRIEKVAAPGLPGRAPTTWRPTG